MWHQHNLDTLDRRTEAGDPWLYYATLQPQGRVMKRNFFLVLLFRTLQTAKYLI